MEALAVKQGKTFDEIIANPCGLVAKTYFNGETLLGILEVYFC
jgi:hypothetical protein